MCNVCGCGEGEVRIEGAEPNGHSHPHDHHHDHDHNHEHGSEPGHTHAQADGASLDYGAGPARAHAPGLSQGRMVQIEQDVLAQNDAYARANRAAFRGQGLLALNLVSSPGSGKTTLLTRTIEALDGRYPVAVIEGDQQTSNDADKIRATGAETVQINTGKGCHLDGHMVGHALERLGVGREGGHNDGVVFIENVGNLVCPAAFDLGEAAKVAILSVTEGEDKPVKYPDMFHRADLMVLNKVDLLPHLEFDVDRCLAYARQVNPDMEVLRLSATTGEGMDAWLDWITGRRRALLEDLAGDLEERAARARAAAEKG